MAQLNQETNLSKKNNLKKNDQGLLSNILLYEKNPMNHVLKLKYQEKPESRTNDLGTTNFMKQEIQNKVIMKNNSQSNFNNFEAKEEINSNQFCGTPLFKQNLHLEISGSSIVREKNREIDQLKSKLADSESLIKSYQKTIASLESIIENKDKQINFFRSQNLYQQNEQLKNFQSNRFNVNFKKEKENIEIKRNRSESVRLAQINTTFAQKIHLLEKQIYDRDESIKNQNKIINEYQMKIKEQDKLNNKLKMVNFESIEETKKNRQDINSLSIFRDKIIDSSKKYINIADFLKNIFEKCSKKIEILYLLN